MPQMMPCRRPHARGLTPPFLCSNLQGDKVPVHLSGYYSPALEAGMDDDDMMDGLGMDDDGEDEDEDEDEEPFQLGETGEDPDDMARGWGRPDVLIEEIEEGKDLKSPESKVSGELGGLAKKQRGKGRPRMRQKLSCGHRL
jgi:hypothetical protein